MEEKNEVSNENYNLNSRSGCSSILEIMTFISALIYICVVVFILNKINLSASTLKIIKYVCFYLGIALSAFWYLSRIYFAARKNLLQITYYKITEFCKNSVCLFSCGLLSILYVTHSYHWYSVLAGIILVKISAIMTVETYIYKLNTKETDKSNEDSYT